MISRTRSNGSTSPSCQGSPDTQPPSRSCTFCRSRKIKCDRQQPCSNCVRSKSGAECLYPPGPGRRPKRSRQLARAKISTRLDRLQTLIEHLAAGPSPLSITDRGDPQHGDGEAHSPASEDTDHPDWITRKLGRLVIDDTNSYYVGNIFWARLGQEVEELRNMLDKHDGSDDDYPVLQSSPSIVSSEVDASVLGLHSVAGSLLAYHPLLSQSLMLLKVFKENVVPVVKILHMPTTERMVWDSITVPGAADANTEALLFAIYYAAVASMEHSQCAALLGLPRESTLQNFHLAVTQALARANLLRTESIVVLQAAVLFIEALRTEDDTRTVWSLTALVVHIAKSMGLHRDGTTFNLKPFETELRRRLWYHICLLDVRSSEYHGYEPIVDGYGFDTKLPLHINDCDLTTEMIEPPLEREETCEMTLCLVRSEYMRLCWKINHAPLTGNSVGTGDVTGMSWDSRQKLIKDFEVRLEQRYLCHCTSDDPFQLLTHTIARLMIARSRLYVYTLRSASGTSESTNTNDPSRDQQFQQSIEVLELSNLLFEKEELTKWSWHTKTHTQWQSVAFVLSEICMRPASPDCDRAWVHACTLVEGWKAKMPSRTGLLWTPIRRLLARARYVRELQQELGSGTIQNAPDDTTLFTQYFEPDETQTLRWGEWLLNAQ